MKSVADQLREQSEIIDALQRRLDAVCEELTELKKWVGMPEWELPDEPEQDEEDKNYDSYLVGVMDNDPEEEDSDGKPYFYRKDGKGETWLRDVKKANRFTYFEAMECIKVIKFKYGNNSKTKRFFPPGCRPEFMYVVPDKKKGDK